jgi:hypothetical protein
VLSGQTARQTDRQQTNKKGIAIMSPSDDEKHVGAQLETHISGADDFTNLKDDTIRVDLQNEHELTVKEVFTKHPALVFWAFYWAMAGVGW